MIIDKLLIVLFLFAVGKLYAQSDFRNGYVINNEGDTIYGKIDYRGDLLMSQVCRFKQANSASIIYYYPYEIKEFRFENSKCYVSRILESGNQVFLEYLIKGKLNVYYFRDDKADYYLIDKEGFPLKVIPYHEGIKYKEDGIPIFYQSTAHIGLLKLYTQGSPDFKLNPEKIKRIDHQNLINFAKDYHNAICKDEKCIIYARKTPFIRASIELTYERSIYRKDLSDFDRTNSFGTYIYLWLPRANEKLFFKTGMIYSDINHDDINYILKIPTQIYYQFSHYNLRPMFCIGLNNYLEKTSELEYFWTISGGIGLNYKITEKLSLTSNLSAELPPLSMINSDTGLLSYSFSFGLRIVL